MCPDKLLKLSGDYFSFYVCRIRTIFSIFVNFVNFRKKQNFKLL